MYQNYIFDLYGTLVDIHTDEENPFLWEKLSSVFKMNGAFYNGRELKKRYHELVLQEQNYSFANAKHLYPNEEISINDIEISIENVINQLFAERKTTINKQQLQDICIFFRSLSLEYICLFEGVKELLGQLHNAGRKIYLLSNAQRVFTEPEMKMLGIYNSFDGILYSSDAGLKKPSALFYKALFDKFSLGKKYSVMTGNEKIADIDGASSFGIDSIYIHTNQSVPFTGKLPPRCRQIQNIAEVF